MKDIEQGVNYLLPGRTPSFFSESKGYNCVSWCEKHLQAMGINPLENTHWTDHFCAVPDRYFPQVKHEENDESNAKGICLIM